MPPFSRTSIPVGQEQPPFSDDLSPSRTRVDQSTSNRSTSNWSTLSEDVSGQPGFLAAGRGLLPPPGLHYAAASTATEPRRQPDDDESAAHVRDSMSVALGSTSTPPIRHGYSDASASQLTTSADLHQRRFNTRFPEVHPMRATARFSEGQIHALRPDEVQAERLRTTALSASSPVTHSGDQQSSLYAASQPSGVPTSTNGSTAESLERAVKSRVAEEIAKQAAAPKCPGASPHYRIKPVFSGTRSAFPDYNRPLQILTLAAH